MTVNSAIIHIFRIVKDKAVVQWAAAFFVLYRRHSRKRTIDYSYCESFNPSDG